MMKLAYVIPNFPLLSETFVAHEVRRLKRSGLDLRVFSFGGPSAADQEKLTPALRELLADTEYIGHGAVLAASAASPLATLRGVRPNHTVHVAATRKANAALRLMRAVAIAERMRHGDITHLHAHWPYASQVAYLAHRITGVSYSISVHAHEVAHDNGHFPLLFDSISFAAFCNRGAMNHLLTQLNPRTKERAHLVYHGVDIDRFAPLALPAAIEPLSIVSAGRLTVTKGFDRLIRACAAARAAGLHVRLTILGRGSLESSLRELARTLGIAEYVNMPGWVSHDQVRGYLRDAHVFALLADTSFHDGLPNVVLEAMASARPVILSPLPAVSEAVTDGSEGFILKHPDDIRGFVACIRSLQNDVTRLRSMGAAARERVRGEHDAQTQIVQLVQLFHSHGGGVERACARAAIGELTS